MKLALIIFAGVTCTILLVICLLACWMFWQPKGRQPGQAQYVTMGSSFAAGPGVGSRSPDSPRICFQSASNYAHLFAGLRGLKLVDVSCSGAKTNAILEKARFLPAQLDAVETETKLVTITVGGNDVSYVGNLIAWSAGNAPERFPWFMVRFLGKPVPPETVDRSFSGLETNLRRIVEGVHRRAPAAKVVFVDYVTILPRSSSCWNRAPLTADQLERGRLIAARLEALTQKVAAETGSELLKASELTMDHDVCSADPWVFGVEIPSKTSRSASSVYHPNEKAMQAIAEKLDRMLPQF